MGKGKTSVVPNVDANQEKNCLTQKNINTDNAQMPKECSTRSVEPRFGRSKPTAVIHFVPSIMTWAPWAFHPP